MNCRLSWGFLFGAVILITGCGGGGGGNLRNSSITYLRTEVPYPTPISVATVDPLVNQSGTGYKVALLDTFTADITGPGSQDVILAGRMTQPTTQAEWGDNRIHMFSWNNGTLIDRTSQWFPGDSNLIIGTEGQVKFADFFKTGRTDMFIAPTTDSNFYGPSYLFRNTGTNFSRTTLPTNIGAHGADIADFNGDGYKDIVMIEYGSNSTVAINDRVSNFKLYTDANKSNGFAGTAIAAADFLQNGRAQVVITDGACPDLACTSAPTRMFTVDIDPVTDKLSFNYHSTLPTPRFDLPKWDYKRAEFGLSHNIYAVAYDFNDDKIPDVLISSRPSNTGAYSEIQFLKNNGTGTFVDVTDTTLVGYNTNTQPAQYFRFLDLNGDGREDILAAGAGIGNSQMLLKSADGKYVVAYQNILTEFSKQAAAIQNGYDSTNTSVNIIKSPNGKLYLLTGVNYIAGEGVASDRKTSIYLSELGPQGITTAKTAVELIQQKWPYMTNVQANTVLAQTAQNYYSFASILDLDAAMSPVGALTLALGDRNVKLSGLLAGVQASPEVSKLTAVDSFNRAFSINFSPTAVSSNLNYWNYNTELDQKQLTSQSEFLVNGGINTVNGMRVAQDPKNFTFGTPAIELGKNWFWNVQYTTLGFNPWFVINGAWGKVLNSTILESVNTYRKENFQAQIGFMNVSTNIDRALITRVSDMQAVWAEAGFVEKKWGLYAGVKPVILNGHVEANLPTSVDYSGNIHYTKTKMNFQNPVNGYVRALYTDQLTTNLTYKLSGMIIDTGHFRLQSELRFSY